MIHHSTLRRAPLATSVAALLAMATGGLGATLYWDGGTTGPATSPADGGTGEWADGVNNWLTAGGLPQAWSNAGPDSAVLGVTAGTVVLASPITAGSVQFDIPGYTVLSGNALTLAPGGFLTGKYAANLGQTSIQAPLAGADIVINPLVVDITQGLQGQGTFSIGANAEHTGTLTVSNGVVDIAAGTSVASGSGIVVNGAGLYHPAATTTHPFWNTRMGILRIFGTGDSIGTQMVTLNGGTLMRVSGLGGNDTGTIANLTLASGESQLVSAPQGATAGDTLAITSLTRSSTATVQFRSSYGPLGAAGDNGKIQLTTVNGSAVANVNGILGGWAYANVVGATQQGSTQASSFAAWNATLGSVEAAIPDKSTNTTGGVLVSQALSTAVATDNFLVNNNSTINTNLTVNSLIAQNDVIVNDGATLTIASGGLIYRGGNFWIQSSTNNGKITTGDVDGKLYLNVANTLDAATDYRLRLQIVDNGGTPLQLIKAGNGSIRLGTYNNGTNTLNTYTGGTIVQAGRILADSANAFGAGPVTILPGGGVLFSVGGNFTNAFTLAGMGAPENAGQLGALRFSGNAEVSGAVTLAGDIRINAFAANDTGRITGPISGNGYDIEKTGLGTVTLSNVNSSYTGDVLVNEGTLGVQGASGGTTTALGLNLATRRITVNTGAALAFSQNNIFGGAGRNASELPTIVVKGTLSTTRFNIVGNLELSGATVTQATTDTGAYFGYQFLGTVNVAGTSPSVIQSTNGTDNHLRGGGVNVFNVADVTSSSAADLSVTNGLRDGSGDYAGVGTLTKAGLGTMVLAGVNGYTGSTNVDAGTLLVNGSLTGSSVALVADAATLGGTGAISGNVVTLTGGTLLGGDGLLPSGQLSVAGDLTMGDGTTIALTLGGAGAHSSIVRSGAGFWTFDSDQAFSFFDAGISLGTYDNIISGLGFDPVVTGWTIETPGVLGTFTYDNAGGVDLQIVAVPEPGTIACLLGGMGMLLGLQRQRRRK